MKKEWNVEIDGSMHNVSVKTSIWSSKVGLTVDGDETILRKSWKEDFVGMDVPFRIESADCHLVISGNVADLSVDGIYMGTQEPYEPLKPMPKWAWIFVVLCLVIPVLSTGGAIPVVIGLTGASSCAKTACAVRGSTTAKIINCIFTTVLCWGVWFALVMMLVSVQG